ncbi:hypothetical protein KW868_04095 [Acinetobacter guillouiae]|uniref:Lipoprotein n=2 Tax=Acinetobacter guillouiae TaxID=106649 RepID=A0A8X8GC57_ACIGI|nr:hypothetical protein [Acinetobacter guillouiae]MCF0263648.1 hypothetical protein [Acinetobacter guillouiae]
MRTSFISTFLTVMSCSLLACQPSNITNKNIQLTSQQLEVIDLHFGEQGLKDFTQYSHTPIDRQPAGMNFLSLDWTPPQLGKVKVVTGKSNFEIDNVISVMGTQIARRSNDGIQIMDINASLHQNEYTNSQEAYTAYTKIIDQINTQQWKQYFLPNDARLDKKDNLKYMSQNMGEVIDPSYTLSFKEWQEMMVGTNGTMYFNLYNNDVTLGITFTQTHKDDKKEQYMVRYSFEHFRYAGRNAISDSDTMNPEQLQQAFLKELNENKNDRRMKESRAKIAGYQIDETYNDPDIWQYVQ